MAKFTVTINCDGAAFEDADHGPVPELKRLMKVIRWMIGETMRHDASRIDFVVVAVCDVNGNAVGDWTFERDVPEVTSEDEPDRPAGVSINPDCAPGTSFLGDPPKFRSVPITEIEANKITDLRPKTYVSKSVKPLPPVSPTRKRTYPAKKAKKGQSRYLDPDAPLDTPSLDTSFHDGEMDV